MRLNFISMSENELQSHCEFRFSEVVSRRNLRLDQVMPINDDLAYCVILDELYVKIGNEIQVCKDFDAFFNLIHMDREPESLETARRKLQLLEGSIALPDKVKAILIDASQNSQWILIRCWEDPNVYSWMTHLLPYLASDDLLDILPNTFGEFEFFDESSTWYMRARDDDPFLFLAAQKKVVSELETKARGHVMKLPRSFIYSS